MTSVPTPKESIERYTEILRQNGITRRIKEVQTILPKMGGDHFFSQCECVSIYFDDDSSSPLELFVKKMLLDSEYSVILRGMEVFETEAAFFSSIFPDMLTFAKNNDGFDLTITVPKCYHADEDLVVMENLVSRGYVMLDKLSRHTLEHSSLVLNNLAKLQGTSYALINEMGESTFLKKYPSLVDAHMWSEAGALINGPFLGSIFETTAKILRKYPTPGSDQALKHVEEFEVDGFSKLGKYFDLKNPACAKVVAHGDLWGPNVLFKAKEGVETFEECVLIDFQMAHLGSPALDLVYYMFMAVDEKVRRKDWKMILELYYEQFKKTVHKLGREVSFTFNELVKDFRKSVEVGYFFGLFLIFGAKVIENLPDIANIEGSVMEAILGALYGILEQDMDDEGVGYSVAIVEAYHELEKLRNEVD